MNTEKKSKQKKEKRRKMYRRIFPEKDCPNPVCQYGGRFIPHRANQDYCCPQCGTDHRNDKNGKANKTVFAEEKILRQMDIKFAKLFEQFYDGKCCLIRKENFQLQKIDLRYFVIAEKNSTSGMNIHWLYKYGTELHSEDSNWIYIHKRISKIEL